MQFELKVARGEEIASISLEAPDAKSATHAAEAEGYSVLGEPRQTAGGLSTGWQRKRFNLNLFSQELHALLDSGLSLVEAIEALSEKEGSEEGGEEGRGLTGACTPPASGGSTDRGASLDSALQQYTGLVFEAMAKDPETELMGLRGLFNEARQSGDLVAAPGQRERERRHWRARQHHGRLQPDAARGGRGGVDRLRLVGDAGRRHRDAPQ